MLVLSRKPNETIIIGTNIKIKILQVNNDQVRIGIEAPTSISVHREEIFNKIKKAMPLPIPKKRVIQNGYQNG